MSTPTSQGSSVAFGGFYLGRLRSWQVQPGTASFEEYTNVGSEVIGSGPDARVVRQYLCTAIDPGGVNLSFFGVAPFDKQDIGRRGVLSVTFDTGGGLSSFGLEAYIEDFDGSGNVGEFIVGTAKFKFSGTGWSS